uniref:Palmdelphin n=1 Tax=Sphaeramia orbicularis TaxID=375764 RepID=A0A672ZX34_9TELE
MGQVGKKTQTSGKERKNVKRKTRNKEIEALEMQELSISANEEAVLKRLKEVERTAEDIIKVGLPHTCRVTAPPAGSQRPLQEPKKATFAVEISVEHDKKTGKSQVVSTATVTPEDIREKGLKVYEDGRKSVYALHPDGRRTPGSGAVGEMTPTEVEELLRQATEAPSEVRYHRPVYATPYAGTSRPSTPRTPNKTPSPSCFQRPTEERRSEHDTRNLQSETPSPNLNPQTEPSDVPAQPKMENLLLRPKMENLLLQLNAGGKSTSNRKTDTSPKAAALVSVTAKSEGVPVPIMPLYRSVEVEPQEIVTDPDLVDSFPEEPYSGPITMIFMGYEKADEDEGIQAELVVIGNSDDDDNDTSAQEFVSYHPEGYRSKVFQPKVGVAKVTGHRDAIDDAHTRWDDLAPHKPTFIHRPGKGRRPDESADAGSINMEKMKMCSTQR